MDETSGEIELDSILVGNDAVELDLYVLKDIFINHEIPDYIRKLQK